MLVSFDIETNCEYSCNVKAVIAIIMKNFFIFFLTLT